MFTGIIEEIGKIKNIRRGSHHCTLEIEAFKILSDAKKGDSISVNGICLTITDFSDHLFTVDVMNETWNKTALFQLHRESYVNLERAMAVNSRFGGHIVTGHIDGTGKIRSIRKDGNAIWYEIETAPSILDLIVDKGSIAIDGISLTVADVSKSSFSVSIIPHTIEETILKEKRVQDLVNLENDILGKYIKKFVEKGKKSELSKDFLQRYGY